MVVIQNGLKNQGDIIQEKGQEEHLEEIEDLGLEVEKDTIVDQVQEESI